MAVVMPGDVDRVLHDRLLLGRRLQGRVHARHAGHPGSEHRAAREQHDHRCASAEA
jgi:hypothetical protein